MWPEKPGGQNTAFPRVGLTSNACRAPVQPPGKSTNFKRKRGFGYWDNIRMQSRGESQWRGWKRLHRTPHPTPRSFIVSLSVLGPFFLACSLCLPHTQFHLVFTDPKKPQWRPGKALKSDRSGLKSQLCYYPAEWTPHLSKPQFLKGKFDVTTEGDYACKVPNMAPGEPSSF